MTDILDIATVIGSVLVLLVVGLWLMWLGSRPEEP